MKHKKNLEPWEQMFWNQVNTTVSNKIETTQAKLSVTQPPKYLYLDRTLQSQNREMYVAAETTPSRGQPEIKNTHS